MGRQNLSLRALRKGPCAGVEDPTPSGRVGARWCRVCLMDMIDPLPDVQLL